MSKGDTCVNENWRDEMRWYKYGEGFFGASLHTTHSHFSSSPAAPSFLPVKLLLMDSVACEDVCHKLNGIIDSVEVNNDVSTHKNLVPAVPPITPDSVRGENGDLHSPLTLSPRTPKDAVFDPFAPGPDVNKPRPPNRKTYLDQLRLTIARRLNFDPDHDDDDAYSLSDEDLFESVYENLLQVIVSKQTEEGILAAAQLSNVVEYDSDDCKTPPPLSFLLREELNTCPGAPIKVKRRINIQLGLCKKLEF